MSWGRGWRTLMSGDRHGATLRRPCRAGHGLARRPRQRRRGRRRRDRCRGHHRQPVRGHADRRRQPERPLRRLARRHARRPRRERHAARRPRRRHRRTAADGDRSATTCCEQTGTETPTARPPRRGLQRPRAAPIQVRREAEISRARALRRAGDARQRRTSTARRDDRGGRASGDNASLDDVEQVAGGGADEATSSPATPFRNTLIGGARRRHARADSTPPTRCAATTATTACSAASATTSSTRSTACSATTRSTARPTATPAASIASTRGRTARRWRSSRSPDRRPAPRGEPRRGPGAARDTMARLAPVAQWIERCPPEAEVGGSNPSWRADEPRDHQRHAHAQGRPCAARRPASSACAPPT